jgi:hypothetical protein
MLADAYLTLLPSWLFRTGSRGLDGRYDSSLAGQFMSKGILRQPPPQAAEAVSAVLRYGDTALLFC